MSQRSRKLVYVTDLERRRAGGGSYVVNWNAADQLEKRFALKYAGPLTPRPPWIESTVSKVQRHVMKRPGRFAYFSPATLDANARMVELEIDADADAVVFRSSARWCRSRPRVPYFVYLDAVFHTFYHNTFDPRSFVASDLERIWKEEAEFLESASGVFFESEWGLQQARHAYGLKGSHYYAPGRGGVVEPPAADTWKPGTHALLTIALSFRQKGGDLVLEAYRSLKDRFPSLTWTIIGEAPDSEWKSIPGITHEGALDLENTADREKFTKLMAEAFAIVHPTREDTSPLVLTEAAYFGCPAVSVNRFAIPELVTDGVTGILVDPPASASDVAAAIARMIENDDVYRSMRREARERSIARFSWPAIGKFMGDRIDERLSA